MYQSYMRYSNVTILDACAIVMYQSYNVMRYKLVILILYAL